MDLKKCIYTLKRCICTYASFSVLAPELNFVLKVSLDEHFILTFVNFYIYMLILQILPATLNPVSAIITQCLCILTLTTPSWQSTHTSPLFIYVISEEIISLYLIWRLARALKTIYLAGLKGITGLCLCLGSIWSVRTDMLNSFLFCGNGTKWHGLTRMISTHQGWRIDGPAIQ